MIKRLSFAAMLSVILFTAPAGAAESLVDAAWVKANIATDNVVFLDLRGNPRAFQAPKFPTLGGRLMDATAGGPKSTTSPACCRRRPNWKP